MASKQDLLRERVVRFYLNHIEKGKVFTVKHFQEEEYHRVVIYRILRRYEQWRTTKRKPGSGRKVKIMTKKRLEKLKEDFENKDKISQKQEAKKFNCSQQYISCMLRDKLNIKGRRKQKSPGYTEDQIELVKSQCRWMVRNVGEREFVLDDEKYFGLSNSNSGNIYYSSDPSLTPIEVKYKFKKKYEPHIMLYQAISSNELSKPWFKRGGFAVNKKIYIEDCLKKITIPFLKRNHQDGNFWFWPDKASSHYARHSWVLHQK